jgi:creatinine amidohydrolase
MENKDQALALHEISTIKAKNLPLADRVVVIPIGSNEQHGPHLPTGTDTIILEAVVKGVRHRFSPMDPFLFIPIMPFGESPEHMDFCGTISLKAATLLSVMEDIVSSLHAHGANKFVFLNSHGGNTSLLGAIAHELRYSKKVEISCLNFWSEEILSYSQIAEIIPGLDYPEIHAASVETSILLYLNPDFVGDIPEKFQPKAPYPAIPTGWSTADLSDNGIIGDPRNSSSERGKQLYQLFVDRIVAILLEIAR